MVEKIYPRIEDDSALFKCSAVWDKIKEIQAKKFHSNPVYDEKYIKAKVKKFKGVVNINILGNEVPKEAMHYTSIPCINIDSVLKMDIKSYPQVYLEECKYKIKKTEMPEFIDVELELDSCSDSE